MTQTPQDTPAGAKGSKVESNVVDLATVPARLKRFDRLMGIDLGTKTIGLALSDVERSLASPLETIARRKFTLDVEAMLKLAAKYEVAVFVIGLPLNMDGTEGPRSQATRAFVRAVAAKTQIPFVYWDERMSTAADSTGQRAASAAMANLADGVQALVKHMRSEQQMIRDWVEQQAGQNRDIKKALERLAQEREKS